MINELKVKPLVYVSGMMTDGGRLPIADAAVRFAQGCIEVAQLGYQPVNPMVSGLPDGSSWREYMNVGIRSLLQCDGIYLLRGWENSRGARLEKLIADGLDMTVLYQP